MRQFIAFAFLFSLAAFGPTRVYAQSRGTPTAQRGQRSTVKAPMPMTLRQVIESLSTLRNSSRVEDLVSKAGVQFQATPANMDILKQFGASAKLLSMIPAPVLPPSPAQPPAPKPAGPLTIICQPKDCVFAIDDRYEGSTEHNRKTVSGLHPGDVTVQVFADGYEQLTQRIQLSEGKPAEQQFLLKPSLLARQNSARASVLKALASLGSIDGIAELTDLEVDGTMQWTDSDGKVQQWTVAFNRHPGRNLSATFKTSDGQCTASIAAQTSRADCKGALKNGGDKVAEQASTVFLSYQLQDVLHALVQRPVVASEADENRVESMDTADSYVLTVGEDGLPAELVYQIGDKAPIQVRYSNYSNVNKGRYPHQIAIGRVNSAPVWVFNLKTVHSRIVRN